MMDNTPPRGGCHYVICLRRHFREAIISFVNDSEALMTADNNIVVWTTSKQDCDSAALGLKTNSNYLPVNWHIVKQGILNVVMPTDPSQDNCE